MESTAGGEVVDGGFVDLSEAGNETEIVVHPEFAKPVLGGKFASFQCSVLPCGYVMWLSSFGVCPPSPLSYATARGFRRRFGLRSR